MAVLTGIFLKRCMMSWVPVVTPVILATQEVEIRRIAVQSQPSQIVQKTLSQKIPSQKGWWSGSACSSSPSTTKKKKKILW
jgi:hypothetical protein